MTSSLERSRQELAAAASLLDAGFARQAISRSYYAVFYAAQDVLRAVGEDRSKHSGVVSAFTRIARDDPRLAGELGRILRGLFDERNLADYDARDASPESGERTLADARRFVDAIEAWLGGPA